VYLSEPAENIKTGAVRSCIAPLVTSKSAANKQQAQELIHQLLDKRAGNIDVSEQIYEIAYELEPFGSKKKKEIRRRQVTSLLHAARQASGAGKMEFAQQARTIASNFDLSDEAEEAALLLEHIPPEEDGMVVFSGELFNSTISIVSFIVKAPSWQDVFKALSRWNPLQEDTLKNVLADSIPDETLGILALASTEIVGNSNELVETIRTEDKAAYRMDSLTHALLFVAGWQVALALRERHEACPLSAQMAYKIFKDECPSKLLLLRTVKAICYWLEGDPDTAAHILPPLIEANIRELLKSHNHSTTTTATNKKLGGVSIFGGLLQKLKNNYPCDWVNLIQAVLTDQKGLNLRNTFMHGMSVKEAEDGEIALMVGILATLLLC
jgi:hypothetical protein